MAGPAAWRPRRASRTESARRRRKGARSTPRAVRLWYRASPSPRSAREPLSRPAGPTVVAAVRPRFPTCRRRATGPRAASRRARAGKRRRAGASRPGEIDADHRQVPVRREDLEAPLLLAPERVLVGEQTFELRVGKRFVRRRRVLPHDRHAIVPAAVLGAVKAWCLRGDLLRVAELDLALQDRKMVLLEQPDELVGETPANLVVVLHHERLRRARRRRPLGDARCRCRQQQAEDPATQQLCLLIGRRLTPSAASACPDRAFAPSPPWAQSPRCSSPDWGCDGSSRGGTPPPGRTPRAARARSRSDRPTPCRQEARP